MMPILLFRCESLKVVVSGTDRGMKWRKWRKRKDEERQRKEMGEEAEEGDCEEESTFTLALP